MSKSSVSTPVTEEMCIAMCAIVYKYASAKPKCFAKSSAARYESNSCFALSYIDANSIGVLISF